MSSLLIHLKHDLLLCEPHLFCVITNQFLLFIVLFYLASLVSHKKCSFVNDLRKRLKLPIQWPHITHFISTGFVSTKINIMKL